MEGKRCPRFSETCQVKKEAVTVELSTLDKFTVLYSNVDSLPNKMQELMSVINNTPCKPKLIALTEIKHKNKWETNLSELAIPGYNIISNNLNTNTRGIVVYVKQDLICKQLNYDSSFSEFILLEIACTENTKLTVGVFYRSPSSTTDNDQKLFDLLNGLCAAKVRNLLCLGDFNWPNISWSTWTTVSRSGSEIKFIDTLRKNFLNQHVSKPTRSRGDDDPHILDLVISNEAFIENIDMLAPVGKSDHSVLSIDCKMQINVSNKVIKYNYNKGDYDGLRQSFQLNWNELLLPFQNDIDGMWQTFKRELQNRLMQFMPKMNNTWKEEGWSHALNLKTRELIS